ncbi:MAG: precorrin-6Y C5,15-methyltransferase (decarboxylating) subunit CbiT [Syntrophomonadaceae bacterium]|nr:precorrin-6Y C5,15-methyltransferase (decarboxylating) subunit CbiT [Syntrophomonadaceae bacterium]
MRWIRDEEFIRGSVPMTKFDVRIAAMAALEIEKGDIFLDIGAGTGSISIEAALQGACVTAVEAKEEGVKLIGRNASKFGVAVEIIKGQAPYCLRAIRQINKCFIGGSGGNLKQIFETVHAKMSAGGIIAANFITIKNLNMFVELLNHHSYTEMELKLLQVSYMEKTGILKAQNPIFLARGRKP